MRLSGRYRLRKRGGQHADGQRLRDGGEAGLTARPGAAAGGPPHAVTTGSARPGQPDNRSRPRAEPGGYTRSHAAEANCGLRSADRRGAGRRSPGYSGWDARLTDDRYPPEAGGRPAQFAQTCQDSASGIADACGPKSPDSHRVVWGLTSRPPVSPAGFPPVSRLPTGFFPFVRRPLVQPVRRWIAD